MKLLLILLSAAIGMSAQLLSGWSYIYIDPGSGAITALGYSQVYDSDPELEYMTAEVYSYVVGGSAVYAQDNCGQGCAQVQATAAVWGLGLTYVESSSHYGAAYSYGGGWSDSYDTRDSWAVPGPPNISLQSIDASNPRSVAWTYNVYGSGLASQALEIGPFLQYSQTPTFHVDQVSYPSGQNPASFVGFMYGIAVQGPICYVNRADGVSVYRTFNWQVPDDGAIIIPVTHDTAEVITTISYCIPPAGGAGSLTVAITDATGSIDTSGATWVSDGEIYDITEDHRYYAVDFGNLGPETRPTEPGQGYDFQSRDTVYPFTLWFPSGAVTQICNAQLQIFDHRNPNSVFNTWPLGCNGHTLN